jgi:hypothetical protein
MNIDPDNPVVVLCAAGMAVGGDSSAALPLFEQAWLAQRNDYDACIAAHFVARHQATPEETLHWNGLAVHHASKVRDGSVIEFMSSLYLCLGDALANLDRYTEALAAASAGRAHLAGVPNGGYRDFIENGISRLESRLGIEAIRAGHLTNVAADERSDAASQQW